MLTIHVDWRKNSGDIATYVQKCTQKSRRLSQLSTSYRLEIERTLIEKSQGMFLWIDLMLRELNKKSLASSMLESLRKAPRGLNEMLRHTLETFSKILHEEEANVLNTILACVACAEQPLTLSYLEAVLKQDLADRNGTSKVEEDDMVVDLETTLRTQYASFFLLDRDDGLTTADLEAEETGGEISDSGSNPVFYSNKRTTIVVFCHASIGDYLRNPDHGKLKMADGSVWIGVDIIQAQVNALKRHLKAIRDYESHNWEISEYALLECMNYLKRIVDNIQSVNLKETGEIGTLLCGILMHAKLKIFSNEYFADLIIRFIHQKNMELIVKIFAACANTTVIDDEKMRVWMQGCVVNPPQTFEPFGQLVAGRWLGTPWRRRASMDNMKAVWTAVILLEGRTIDGTLDLPSVSTVLAVARWAQLKEDAFWHHNVGACLSRLKHYDAAIEHLEMALQLQPELWISKEVLALTYKEEGNSENAIRLQKECEMHARQERGLDLNRDKILSRIREHLADTYAERGDWVQTLYWLRQCFDVGYDGDMSNCLRSTLRLLISVDDSAHDEIMQMIKSMDRSLERVLPKSTYLGHYLLDGWMPRETLITCAIAAKATGELQWLESKVVARIAEIRRDYGGAVISITEEFLALLYDRFMDDVSKATRIWKRLSAVPAVTATFRGSLPTWSKNRAISDYAYRLFSDSLRNATDSQGELRELEKLSQSVLNAQSHDETLVTNYSAMYMGIWHQIHGRFEHARTYLKPYVKHSLQRLCDDDVFRATWAFNHLGKFLATIGDDINATAAFQFVHTSFTARDGRSASPEQRMASPWLLPYTNYYSYYEMWYCGGCIRRWGNYTHGNICRYCETNLCDRCLDVLKSENPFTHACHPSHTWLHIPPPTAIPGEGQIIRGAEVISINDFRAMLEEAWI